MALSMSLTAVARQALHSPRIRANHGSAHAGPGGSDRHVRELFLNHLWESLNTGAKILFFAVLTPIMLSVWGNEMFGLFAVANSTVALMAFFDLGLRTVTRIGLTSPDVSENAKIRLHALHIAAFSLAAGVGVSVVALLAFTGCWHRWLNLPRTGDFVIVVAAALTAVLMWLQLALERIASAGRLSRVKAALFVGNLLAFAIVFALLRRGEAVAVVTSAYFAALALPLLFLLPFADLRPRLFSRAFASLQRREIFSALRAGGSINLITASWIFQSYGLVLLISWIIGPAAAGTFFLYLKLSELLSVLGASASEPTIAALAGAPNPSVQHRRFAAAYKSAIAMCLTGAIGYTFFGNDLFHIWLHRSLTNPYTGFLIGLFGVVTGFNRMVTAASLGLSKPGPVAFGLLGGGVITAGSVIAFQGRGGPELILAINCVAGLFVVPSAVIIARDLGSNFVETWLQPLARFAPGLAAIVVICAAASYSGYVTSISVAAVISALICLRYLFQRSSEDPPAGAISSPFGYDTRSWRSALVMRAVDLINPFRRSEKFVWTGPCVISSTAGLGDLFIHLPLVAGALKEAQRRGMKARVALRPAHVAIGVACGWDVMSVRSRSRGFFQEPLRDQTRKTYPPDRQRTAHQVQSVDRFFRQCCERFVDQVCRSAKNRRANNTWRSQFGESSVAPHAARKRIRKYRPRRVDVGLRTGLFRLRSATGRPEGRLGRYGCALPNDYLSLAKLAAREFSGAGRSIPGGAIYRYRIFHRSRGGRTPRFRDAVIATEREVVCRCNFSSRPDSVDRSCARRRYE